MIISERKQQILESCKSVFAEKGFFGSSSKELARKCGISESLLYKHFPTKEILFRSTIEEAISYYKKIPFEEVIGETNFLRNIAFALLKPDEQTFRLLLFAYLELDKQYLLEFLQIFRSRTRQFFNNNQRKQTCKQTRNFDKVLVGSLTGLNLLYPEEKNKMIDDFVQLMLHGLCK